MSGNPDEPRIVLLLNVPNPLGELLGKRLARQGVTALPLETDAIFHGDIHIPLNGSAVGSGWIRPRGAGRTIRLRSVCGTVSGEQAVVDEDEFAACEKAAVLHMVRMACGNPLNRGLAGSPHAYVLSLPEQWARCARHGVPHPGWQVHAQDPAGEGRVVISHLHDRSVRRTSDPPQAGAVRIAASAPRGAVVRCAFAGDVMHLSRRNHAGIADVSLPPAALGEVAALVAAVRHAFGIDYGELVFSYLGRPVFWSVVPQLSPDILEGPAGENLVDALADMVSR